MNLLIPLLKNACIYKPYDLSHGFSLIYSFSLSQETATEASNNQQDISNGICVYAVSNSLWNKVKPHCLRFLLKVFEGSFLEFCFILSL